MVVITFYSFSSFFSIELYFLYRACRVLPVHSLLLVLL